jgi:hypothetical protein
LQTVSRDESRNRLVGLHVDYWDKDPLARRVHSRNRLCVNIGYGDRYFIFVNLTLSQLRDKLEATTGIQLEEPAFIGQTFLRTFPLYPVTRILLKPGEGYIAPTENILHDGSSLGLFVNTCHAAFQGHFELHDAVSDAPAFSEDMYP